MSRGALLALLFACILMGFHYTIQQAPPPEDFVVPDGFAVEEVYAPELAGSVVSITFDSQGELVISREDSSIFRLFDSDGDGVFDEEQLITDQVVNSQGLLFEGTTLFAVGDPAQEGDEEEEEDLDSGLYRVIDADGNGAGDQVELVTQAVDGIQEHGPHNVFFGPDGYVYWAMGNHTDLRGESPAPLSPLNEWDEGVLALDRTDARGHADDIRAPGGKFYRKPLLATPDADWEMVVGGFRNQYDGSFNLMGELFTLDSDMEWDRDLPWFRPTRTVHAVPSGDFGWRTGSRKHMPYYIDTLPPLRKQRRGSPVGVTFYQSYNYPEQYWDMFLQGDWSRGRILMSQLARDGATYTEESGGNFVYGEPLNVTDVDVGPDGNVYFALGGRDTQGGLYRVVYNGPNAMTRPEASTPVEEALVIPQPRSAYSRTQLRALQEEAGEAAWQQELTAVARDAEADPERRVRAMELLHVYGPGLDLNTLVPLAGDAAWQVRAAAAYYLGTSEGRAVGGAREALTELLHDADPFVQRRAAEGLIRTGIHPASETPVSAVEDVMPLLSSEDRFVRYAGRALLKRLNRNDWQQAAMAADAYPQAAEALMAYVETIDNPDVFEVESLIQRELELLKADPSNSELIPLLRVIERTMLEDQGVVFTGGWRSDEPGEYEQLGNLLLERFPAADTSVNREIARIAAYLEPDTAVSKLAAELDNPNLSREQQIFYAYALSNISVGWDEAAAEQMVAWFEKVHNEAWRGGASFSGYISLMKEDFLSQLPEEQVAFASERLEALEEQRAAALPAGVPTDSPHNLSNQELAEELIYDPQYAEGDPQAGAAAYQKALCSTCHTFGPLGTEVGPDLTTVGQRFSRKDIVESIIFPSRTISDLWAVETITRTNGETVSGTIYNETADEVVVQIPAGPQVTIPKSEIASREESSQSAMLEGLHHYLEREELSDLILFLQAGPEAIPDSMLSN